MPAGSFTRARTAEQRSQRRTEILATAAAMLADTTRVGELSLNELARRVGLAKSNVLRYFETREAVLLALLEQQYDDWLDELAVALREDQQADPIERVADAVARTATDRPVLCELIATSGTVLEHNVSGAVAATYKQTAYAQAIRLTDLVAAVVGELSTPDRLAIAGAVNLGLGGVWGMCRPSEGMTAAYQEHPELAAMQLDFRTALREFVATTLTGLQHRPVADIRRAP
ncbi:TetR family transcriptional regulator [Microlunatus endophyticus]|uniref:TetR family transcriptional regulator n=1 Tax=Microlunatus endophyticus TaxID=1716077 RepID=A0A917S8G5_9ACTN|nr:TetR family transcriptional regulator [Microlunatus endophyticus]GGL63623.1 TetR family transcriptional regulator [Microlunatus endophyticus]